MTKTRKTSPFEHTTCSRCDGSGYIRGFSHVLGGVCFKCGGSGFRFTKRGAAAHALYAASLCKSAGDLAIGDTIHAEGLREVGIPSRWVVVDELEIGEQVQGSDGQTYQRLRVGAVHTKTGERHGLHTFTNARVRVAHSAEAKRAKLDEALAYQETLTKTGTPRKRKVAA